LEELIAIAIQFTIEVIGSALISLPFGFNVRRPVEQQSASGILILLFDDRRDVGLDVSLFHPFCVIALPMASGR
jgi:hypothetical protein